MKIIYKNESSGVSIITPTPEALKHMTIDEIAKKDAPTLFQINGPVGYQKWKDYCADLKDTDLYSWLRDKDMAVKDGDGVYGIPYVVEGYGIIYNQAIMNKYFALSGAKATSMDEVNNYEKLLDIVEKSKQGYKLIPIKKHLKEQIELNFKIC